MIRIFVFGTLRSGYPNHHANSGERLPGSFVTRQPYPLYLVGERHSPWLIDTPGTGLPVRGELYRIGSEGLRRMDRLERISEPDGYRRRTIELIDEHSGDSLNAEVYLKPREQFLALPATAIRSGPHAEYTPDLATLYRPRP
jgi:gamma-glutamylaminecyclotransferase